MTDAPTDPAQCTSMTEVRAGVDAVDKLLVVLLARRFGYMEAAARIKPDRAAVRDEARKAEVLANIRGHASEHGLPAERLAAVWETLVEQSIAHEFDVWDETRG